MAEPTRQNGDGPDLSTRLAFDRTPVAFERTMLSWIRTGTSLITFGFGVYKFFQIEQRPAQQKTLIGPRQFGLILVAIGLIALAMGALEYRRNLRELPPGFATGPRWATVTFAGSIALLGILAFVVMLARQ